MFSNLSPRTIYLLFPRPDALSSSCGLQVARNLIYEVGYYGKQTSAFFQAMSRATVLLNNTMFGGPRAGVNFNDGFGGGDVMAGNILWGWVRETGDHGPFNSWDRQPYFWVDEAGEVRTAAAVRNITRNLILNQEFVYGRTNADWTIDHDDGSSWYTDTYNVHVWGAHKWRDGANKTYANNLYVLPPNPVQGSYMGIGYYTPNTRNSVFSNNTMVNWQSPYQFAYSWSVPYPAPGQDGGYTVTGNSYYTPGDSSLPFVVGGTSVRKLEDWQATCKCEQGSWINSNVELAEVVQWAENLLASGLP